VLFRSQARGAGLRVFAAPWRMPEADRWQHTFEVLRARQPELAFAYATELDGTLHRLGNDSVEGQRAARRVALRIEQAVEAMRSGSGEVSVIVVGDHGMADIHRVIDPRGVLRALPRIRAFVDSTMMRFWGDDTALAHARARLVSSELPGKWLDLQALDARQAPTSGAPYGQAIFLLDEGVLFAPSFVGGTVRGMHGYDVDSPSAFAALASDVPLPTGCGALTDLSPWIRALLGLPVDQAAASTPGPATPLLRGARETAWARA